MLYGISIVRQSNSCQSRSIARVQASASNSSGSGGSSTADTGHLRCIVLIQQLEVAGFRGSRAGTLVHGGRCVCRCTEVQSSIAHITAERKAKIKFHMVGGSTQ